jgi:hypothetical protein
MALQTQKVGWLVVVVVVFSCCLMMLDRSMLSDGCLGLIDAVPVPNVKAGAKVTAEEAHDKKMAKLLKTEFLKKPLDAAPWVSDDFESGVAEDWYIAVEKIDKTAKSANFLKNARSALKDLYRSFAIQMSPETEAQLKDMYTGMRKMEAQRKAEEGGKLTEGKDPLPFSIFRQMALRMLRDGDPKSVFCHLYLVLSWNLGCRSNNVEKMCFDHIDNVEDALLFRYCFTKTDQEGIDNEPRHVYANSVNPEISAFLSLAIYLATVRLDGSAQSQRLFPGASQYNRFLDDFKEILSDMEDELKEVGRNVNELGAHSIRKGVGTFASSAEDGPGHTSLCRRLNWIMDSVQEKYLKYLKAGDQVCGRYFAGLPRGEPEFALPPPFFLPENEELICRGIEACFGKHYPDGFRGVLRFCLASLIHHYQFLKENLKASHLLWQNTLFLNLDLVKSLEKAVVCRLLTPTDPIVCTGLTSNAKQVLDLKNTVEESIADLKEENKELGSIVRDIPVNVVESVTSLMEERALDSGNITRSNLQDMLREMMTPIRDKVDCLLENGPVETPAREEMEDDPSQFQRFLFDGQFHKYPKDFQFPEGNALSLCGKCGDSVIMFNVLLLYQQQPLLISLT